jgi:preprotein translocase subunit SecB
METLEYYKFIRNSIQFHNVELVSMNCMKRDLNLVKESGNEVYISLHREVKLLSENQAEITLHSKIGIEDGPFEFDIVYKGHCNAMIELSNLQFEQYAYDQVVPLILPYVRECVASTMARMGLPIFTLPTMDVLDAIEANSQLEEDQE